MTKQQEEEAWNVYALKTLADFTPTEVKMFTHDQQLFLITAFKKQQEEMKKIPYKRG